MSKRFLILEQTIVERTSFEDLDLQKNWLVVLSCFVLLPALHYWLGAICQAELQTTHRGPIDARLVAFQPIIGLVARTDIWSPTHYQARSLATRMETRELALCSIQWHADQGRRSTQDAGTALGEIRGGRPPDPYPRRPHTPASQCVSHAS